MLQMIPDAPALAHARYAVTLDGLEEIPHLPFRELLVDAVTTLAVAALETGQCCCIGAVSIRRVA